MRINRNTRRSARPVFRSVNSSRRRAMNSARRRNMNCSANNNVVYYADLNKAQKDYVLANWEKWSEMEWLWNLFYEDEAESEDDTPETWWVDDTLESLSYDDIATFEIVDDKTAVPEKKVPDNFNTYINYLNSSRRRNGRRAVNCRRMLNSGRQRLNCAVAGDIVTFNELNEAQKQSAIEGIWNTKGAEWVYDAFNEVAMEVYRDDIRQLAAECEASIDAILGDLNVGHFEIDTDKLYWNDNSQGPYPKWHLNEVFGGLTIEYLNPNHIVANQSPSSNGKPAVEAVELVWDYHSKKQDADDYTVDIDYFDPADNEWYHDYGIDPVDSVYGIPAEIQEKIKDVVNVLQHFLDTAWSYVRDVSMETPDDDYAYDLYEANDWGDFEVIDDQTAAYYNDDWDDEIAGVDYY